MANATVGMRADGLAIDLLATLEELEGTVPMPWRPASDVPPEVEEILGVWHWGNTAFAFSWTGQEVAVTSLARKAEVYRFLPEEGGTFRGTSGYHHGERLVVERHPDGTINHLNCATFIYTRVPYDPAAPIPGGPPVT